jgi:hypothetical protein
MKERQAEDACGRDSSLSFDAKTDALSPQPKGSSLTWRFDFPESPWGHGWRTWFPFVWAVVAAFIVGALGLPIWLAVLILFGGVVLIQGVHRA